MSVGVRILAGGLALLAGDALAIQAVAMLDVVGSTRRGGQLLAVVGSPYSTLRSSSRPSRR